MSDPAVEAAQRAGDAGFPRYPRDAGLIAAAREALAPLREIHRPDPQCCEDCAKVCAECDYWPCATAKLIYREDEL